MRAGKDSFVTAANIDKLTYQYIHEGDVRYKMRLSDVPLEGVEWRELTEAIATGLCRIEIEIRVIQDGTPEEEA